MTPSYLKPPRRSPHTLELTPESSRVLLCDLTTAFSFALSSYCLPPSSLCSSTPWTLALQSFPKHTVVSSLIIFTHLVPTPAMLIFFGYVLISDLNSCRFLKASPYDSVQKCCPYSPFTSFPSPHKLSQALFCFIFSMALFKTILFCVCVYCMHYFTLE